MVKAAPRLVPRSSPKPKEVPRPPSPRSDPNRPHPSLRPENRRPSLRPTSRRPNSPRLAPNPRQARRRRRAKDTRRISRNKTWRTDLSIPNHYADYCMYLFFYKIQKQVEICNETTEWNWKIFLRDCGSQFRVSWWALLGYIRTIIP